MAPRRWKWGSACAVLLALLLSSPWSQAQDKPKEEPKAKAPPPDADFLEFLGSWDSEDEGWNEFLAEHDVRTTGKGGKPADEEKDAKDAKAVTEPQTVK